MPEVPDGAASTIRLGVTGPRRVMLALTLFLLLPAVGLLGILLGEGMGLVLLAASPFWGAALLATFYRQPLLRMPEGTLVQRRLFGRNPAVAIREAREVDLHGTSSRAPGVALFVRAKDGPFIPVPLLMLNNKNKVTLDPDTVDILAALVGNSRARGKAVVAYLLAEHSAYLRAGGDPRNSPIADRASLLPTELLARENPTALVALAIARLRRQAPQNRY